MYKHFIAGSHRALFRNILRLITRLPPGAAIIDHVLALRYALDLQSGSSPFDARTTYIKTCGFDASVTDLYKDGLISVDPQFAIGYSLKSYGAKRPEIPCRQPSLESVLYRCPTRNNPLPPSGHPAFLPGAATLFKS